MISSRIKDYSPWLDNLKSLYDEIGQPQPRLPENAEIVIIGGGPTGLSAAYKLVDSGHSGNKIVILEKNIVGQMPGRSAGIVSIEPDHDCAELREIYDREKVKLVMDSYIKSRSYIQEIIDKTNMECDFEKSGSLFIGKDKDIEYLKEEASLRRMHGFDAEFRNIKLSEYTAAIYMQNDFTLNPRKFCAELAKYLFSKGVLVYENTEADAFYGDSNRIRIKTVDKNNKTESICADKVVLAGQDVPHDFGYERLHGSDNILSKILGRGISIETYALATRQLNESEIKNIGMESRASFIDIHQPFFYGRLTPDNRLLIGGDDLFGFLSKLFSRKKTESLKEKFIHHFPEFSEADIDYEWKGNMRIMLDVFPLVYNQKNVYVAGPSAHIQYAVLSGISTANQLISNEDNYSELFSDKREINLKVFVTYLIEKIALFYELCGGTERFDD